MYITLYWYGSKNGYGSFTSDPDVNSGLVYNLSFLGMDQG